MFIFDRCRRSSAVVAPAKYKCDSNNLKGAFARSKILLTEKLTNRASVTPTPVFYGEESQPDVPNQWHEICMVEYFLKKWCAWRVEICLQINEAVNSTFSSAMLDIILDTRTKIMSDITQQAMHCIIMEAWYFRVVWWSEGHWTSHRVVLYSV